MLPISPGSRRRTAATAGLVLAAAVPAAVLGSLAPSTLAAARAPGADASALVAAAALAVAALLTLRLLVTTAAVLLAAVPGGAGAAAAVFAARVAPALLRGTVRVAVGATVAAAPLLGGIASAASTPSTGSITTAESAAPTPMPSPGVTAAFPDLDRLVTTGSTVPAAAVPRSTAGGGHVVVVRPGDSLWAIAARSLPPGHSDADVARAWPQWYAANRATVGPDPGLLVPGQQLVPPS